MINPISIISKYYRPGSKAYTLLVEHCTQVADRAIEITRQMTGHNIDAGFVKEAAMLHDIGIFLTHAPPLECRGVHPYLRHGFLGGRILRKEGLGRHALVCERHVGAGISRQDVIDQGLPLPAKDMLPVTLEEKIICYADKFFSKNHGAPPREKPLEDVVEELRTHGTAQVDRFLNWHAQFSLTAMRGNGQLRTASAAK